MTFEEGWVRRERFSIKPVYQKWFLFVASAVSFIALLYFWKITVLDIENNVWLMRSFSVESKQTKNPETVIKGLYLTAYSASRSEKIDEIIDLINQTELNAVVIDIKDYTGAILYNSHVPLVREFGTAEDYLGSVRPIIAKLHANGIYVIARQTVFQDPALAEKKPEWAIKKKSGGVWHDRKGLAWVDPTRTEVWAYNVAIAKEAIRMGFDEINFDYVRFPSDGDMESVVYTTGDKPKYEVMREFYSYLNKTLSKEPAWISIDMFGFVMEKEGDDDMNIGQRLSDAVNNVDYICPMMYPSHYPSGHLGFDNPAEHPKEVFENGMKLGEPNFLGKRAKVRPWVQAFSLGAIYDGDKIRDQIQVIESYPNAGWLLWNASNRYSQAGLKSQ